MDETMNEMPEHWAMPTDTSETYRREELVRTFSHLIYELGSKKGIEILRDLESYIVNG